jgi:CelD/BcsL family acetyltransferase involved in cellulose biosynthesis
MGADLAVDIVRPDQMDVELRGLWAEFRAADPAFRSPYFDLRYVLAAGASTPGAQVAVISRRGRVEGLFAFQRRGRLIQPIAAPLTDYHGLLVRPGCAIDLARLTAALGARRFRFNGLMGTAAPEGAALRTAMIADLSQGYDAYLAGRRSDFLKDKRRRARRLAEAHGPLSFDLAGDGEEALDFILTLKRAQLRRTGQHDIFSSPWVEAFVRELVGRGEPGFGARFATLRAGGRLIAAEMGLQSGPAYHLWFPVYDPQFARYSPGSLMTLETLRALADRGVATVDFGAGGEAYKRDFADPGLEVWEGEVAHGGWADAARGAADRMLSVAPRARRALSEAGGRLDRRWDCIAACEPRLDGKARAVSQALAVLARRKPRASIGIGLGLGLGIYGLLAE